MQAVDYFHSDGVVRKILQLRLTNEAETVAASPAPAESEPPVEVRLFEDDAVANAALVEVALEAEAGFAADRERLPAHATAADNGLAAGGLSQVCNLVVGVIREQCELCAATACGDSSVAGGEGPEVAAANDVHEKRRQGVHIPYLEVLRILHLR